MTYLRTKEARFTGSPEKLSQDMKDAVDSLLEVRVKVRKIHEALSSIASDASGTTFTDNYDDPEIRKVAKSLYEFDRAIGEAFQSIEKMDRDLKKKVKKASYSYLRVASDSLSKGSEVTVKMRQGQWPSDMFNKGSILEITDGGSVGGTLKLKIKGQTMGGPYDFKVVSEKNGVYTLESVNDRFKRGLKVELRDADKTAAAHFEEGDYVRPSKSYLQSLGAKTEMKNGIVTGKSGSFLMVLWNHRDEPVAVSPAALEYDPKLKGKKAPKSEYT